MSDAMKSANVDVRGYVQQLAAGKHSKCIGTSENRVCETVQM